MTTSPSVDRPTERREQRRALIGTGVGNALEWYDWNIYASFTVFIAAQLFNNENPTSAVLSTLAIFAVGFIARPFGGFVFGWIADRRGRKFSLMLAISLASIGSLMIGLAPTFEAVGTFSSLLLLIARLLQGLAHGGELPSAQTYLSEAAPAHRRGLWSSWMYVSGTFGILFGLFVGAMLNTFLSVEAMNAYGWRIPFLLGAVFGVYSLYMRSGMKESEVFEEHRANATQHDRIWPQLVKNRMSALRVIGMTVGITVAYYAWAINAPAYAATTLGIDRGQTLWAGIICNIVFMIALPLWGMLSDKIGRRPVLLMGTLGSALLYFPMQFLLQDQMWQLVASMSVMLIALSAFLSISPAVYAELFPTSVRTIGVGLPYALCTALFGGTAPYLQVWMASEIGVNAFAFYAVGLLIVSSITVYFLPETRGKDLG